MKRKHQPTWEEEECWLPGAVLLHKADQGLLSAVSEATLLHNLQDTLHQPHQFFVVYMLVQRSMAAAHSTQHHLLALHCIPSRHCKTPTLYATPGLH